MANSSFYGQNPKFFVVVLIHNPIVVTKVKAFAAEIT